VATDVEAASATLSDAYAELTLRTARLDDPFRMQLRSVELADLKLATLNLSTSTVRTVPYPTYTVCLPVRGRVRVTAGDASSMVAGHHGIAVCPDSGQLRVDYLTDDCQVFTVTFDRAALEGELGAMLGHPIGSSVCFDLPLDLDRCATFQRSLGLLQAELADPDGLADHPVVSRQAGRLAMAGLLLSQPHPWAEELRRPACFEGPRAIRAAVAAIEARPTDLVTVGDIARVAHLSVRALEDGFQRHVGTSPMTYLRRVRLARAHDELGAAEPEVITATAVALRWGFAHYGRFAAQYRRRYGRSPADTLRASAGGRRAGRATPT
jgi:AraC-like DNA-binding protein